MSVFAEMPIAGGADSRLTAGDQPGGARLLRREVFPVLTRERALPCAPDGARDDARRAVALAADADIQIAGGASSSRPAGDDCRGATGKPGAVQPPPASRPDPVSVYVTADTAAILALLAAERGETLADAVARLAVDEINRKGGIAHV